MRNFPTFSINRELVTYVVLEATFSINFDRSWIRFFKFFKSIRVFLLCKNIFYNISFTFIQKCFFLFSGGTI